MDPCLRRPTGNTYLQYLGAIFKQLLVWLSLHFMVEQLNREPNSPLLECQLCRISKGFIIEKKGEKNMQPAFIYYWLVISKLPHLLQHVNLAKVCSLVFVHGLVAERFKQYLNKGMKISLKGGNEKWQMNKSLKEFRTCAGFRRASLSKSTCLSGAQLTSMKSQVCKAGRSSQEGSPAPVLLLPSGNTAGWSRHCFAPCVTTYFCKDWKQRRCKMLEDYNMSAPSFTHRHRNG